MVAEVTTRAAEVLVEGLHFGEGPRWHDRRFWLSDFYSHHVLSVDVDGTRRIEVELDGDEQPSGLGWLPDGRLLVVAMRSRRVLRREADGRLVTHAELGHIATGHCNDMLVDAQGRAYVGNFGFDLDAMVATHGVEGLLDTPGPVPASLALVLPDGTATAVVNGLAFPNGMALLSGGTTLVVAQTFSSELTAFDVRDDATLRNRRTWAALGTEDGRAIAPDGIAVDAADGIWVADATGSGVLRVTEGGTVTDRVVTGQPAYACALGGDDGRTLVACTAATASSAQAAATTTGRLEVARVGVPAPGA